MVQRVQIVYGTGGSVLKIFIDHLKSTKLIQMATSYSQKALLKTFWETNLDSLHRYVGCQVNMYNQNVQNVKS